jgi:hypothetical protein
MTTSMNKCPFNDMRTVEKSVVFELKSTFGLSQLRDVVSAAGSGVVANSAGDNEYLLSTGGGASDVAVLRSAERVRYVGGIGAEVGMSVRLADAAPSGSQRYAWGAFDDNNGFFFRYDASGLSVGVRRSGADTMVPRSSFSYDKLDGTGPSAKTLSLSDGLVFLIVFSWHGVVNFCAMVGGRAIIMHQTLVTTLTSAKDPNLPIAAEARANGTAGSSLALRVGGRFYNVLGRYQPIARINAAPRLEVPLAPVATYRPLLSIRRKVGYLGTGVRLSDADVVTSANVLVQVRTGATLAGASFGPVPDQLVGETCVEVDTAATDASGGIVVWSGLVSTLGSSITTKMDYLLTEYSPLTVLAQYTGVSGSATVSCVARWTEEW